MQIRSLESNIIISRFMRETDKSPDIAVAVLDVLQRYYIVCRKMKTVSVYPDRDFTNKVVELYKTGDRGNIIIATHMMLNYIKDNG